MTFDTSLQVSPQVCRAQKIIAILWPSFIVAGVATLLFFTTFDPEVILADKSWGDISPLGAYTICFFLFWLLCITSCALSCYFGKPCNTVDPK